MADMKVRFLASLGGNDDFKAELLVDKVLKLDDNNKVIDTQTMQLADVVLVFPEGTQFPEPGKPKADVDGKVTLPGFLSLPIDLDKLVLKLAATRAADGVCTLDPQALKSAVAEKVWDPLVIKSCEASFTFGGQPWQLELTPTGDNKTVAEMTLLGCLFEFDRITLNASGIVYAKAMAKPTAKKPELEGGLENLSLIQGSVELSGSRRQVSLQFSFSLAYFAGSKGLLDIHLSRQEKTKDTDPKPKWLVATSATMNSDATWSDPSGWLSFSKMGLSFDLVEQEGVFTVKQPRASGSVTFRAGALAGAAKEWLGELFSGLRTDFRDISLSNLGGANFSFGFNPAGGFKIRALGIMQLTVAKLSLGVDGFSLHDISLELENLAGAVVRGGVDTLKVTLRGTPKLDMSFGIHLAMSAPSGIKASGSLRYVDTDTLQALEGSGSLTTPTFPGITIKFRVGRARLVDNSGWIPTVVLYAAVPVVIQLFPGVVIRQVALGLGINAEISGTTRLTLAQARKRLTEGLPDASSLAAWQASNTPLVLVARAFAASTQGPNTKQMELYVCDLTLIVTSDFQVAVLGKLWLQTSMDDAQTQAFQALPGAVAMMLLDGQEPSLRVVAQTNSNGLTSMSKSGIVGKMLGSGLPETHLAMEATPNGMALVVGPNPISGDLGPLQISGSSLLALRATPTRSYALLRSSLQAAFGTSASMGFGLVSISASMRFGFSSELVLLGYYDGNSLLVYGRSHVAAYVAVALHLRIGFEIRISLPFGRRITISWAKDWDFELQVHVDLELELALASDGAVGMHGHASISVNLCGIHASLSVPVDVNGETVQQGRKKQEAIENDLKLLLG